MTIAAAIARVSDPIVLAYAGLNFAKHAFWGFFSILGLAYLTEIVALTPAVAGAMLLGSLLFDAFIDPIVGALIDRGRSRTRDYAPFVLGGCALSAGLMSAYFSVALWSSPNPALILCILLSFRLCFSVFDLSDNALAARVTSDPRRRTLISAWRKATQSCAALMVGGVAGWAFALQGEPAAQRIATAAAVAGAAVTLIAALCYAALRAQDRAAAPIVEASMSVRWRALRASTEPWTLAALTFVEACATPMLIGGFIYLSKAMTGRGDWAAAAIACLTLSQIAVLPLWVAAARRIGKRAALSLAHAIAALGLIGLVAAAAADPTFTLLAVSLAGCGYAGVSTMRWSIAPDVVDAVAARTGLRIESGVVGLLTGAIQVGAGVGVSALGAGLALIGPEAARTTFTVAALIAAPPSAANVAAALGAWLWSRSRAR